MAEGKKSVIVYADWINKFEALEDDEAGKLIKHFFRYINDKNPTAPDRITNLAFIDIEQSLKRNLTKWEKRSERSRENGKLGGRPSINNQQKPNETQQVILEPRKPDSVSDNVSVSDSVSDILLEKETKGPSPKNPFFNFKSELLKNGFHGNLIDDWLKVRKLKQAANTETALAKFLTEVQKTTLDQNEVLKICIEKSWKGFNAQWLENINTNFGNGTSSQTKSTGTKSAAAQAVLDDLRSITGMDQ